ncbi:hypothetical protein CTAYLR_010225 [Chrysophaeum taylorii]|uniref:RanBD1 domain-containing protein n=1 Tax=Chrysophaeum taylorii TaxID=2483200 RepID=A0AAD7U6L0_9STRA|nr:hypothetical protein CTAYLR_010225 [Chrysophaeum taylorii]
MCEEEAPSPPSRKKARVEAPAPALFGGSRNGESGTFGGTFGGGFGGGFAALNGVETFGAAPKPEDVSKKNDEQTKNGEESERCLARYRAKLFALGKDDASASWRERGIGQVRLLESRDGASSARVVMRRAQTHLLMLNLKLGSGRSTVAKHADNAIRLACMTSATTSATYLLKVKTREDRDALFEWIYAKSNDGEGDARGGHNNNNNSRNNSSSSLAEKKKATAQTKRNNDDDEEGDDDDDDDDEDDDDEPPSAAAP